MAKDNEFPATHAMVLSSQSKRTSENPSRAAQRRHLQSSSDINPSQEVGPPNLSHGNNHREPLRSNPASTPQCAAITPSGGYQLASQPLRHEPMARPSLAPTMPLGIYLTQVSQLPSTNPPAPHWSKPQVVRSNKNPYGVRPRRRARRINRWKFQDLIARYQEYIGELDPSTQGNERTKRILGDRIRAFHHELRQLGIEVNISESHPLLGRVGFSADRIRLKQEQFDRAHEDLQARLVSIAQSALQGSSMQ
ncbi:MAG: hypothetical protein Q9215_002526 [Flavoplaca cf. flavocitrina]